MLGRKLADGAISVGSNLCDARSCARWFQEQFCVAWSPVRTHGGTGRSTKLAEKSAKGSRSLTCAQGSGAKSNPGFGSHLARGASWRLGGITRTPRLFIRYCACSQWRLLCSADARSTAKVKPRGELQVPLFSR